MISKKYSHLTHSQVFVIDLIAGSVLAIVSFAIFFTYYYQSDPPQSLYDDIFEFSNALSTIKINDLNNDFVRDLFISQKISDVDNTILQQISNFYEIGNLIDAQNLTQEMTSLYLTRKIGYEVNLDNGTHLHILDSSTNFGSKENARIVVSVDKKIIGFTNQSPYIHTYTFEAWEG